MVALAATHTVPFNSDFYMAAATVIPIYFVALLVAPGMLGGFLRAAHTHTKRAKEANGAEADRLKSRARRAQITALIVLEFAIGLSMLGEVSAVICLASRKPFGGAPFIVLIAMLALPVTAGITAIDWLDYSVRRRDEV